MITNDDDAYATAMRNWRLAGAPEWLKPRADFQTGSHIDSLPVEKNPPLRANKLIPDWYKWRGPDIRLECPPTLTSRC